MNRTFGRLVIVAIAGVAVFAGISIYGDLSQLGARLSQFSWWTFGAAIGLALVNYGVRFLRWEIYLRRSSIDVPPKPSLLIFLSGFALSITPGKMGELIKSYLLRATVGTPVMRSAPIVVAERLTDLIGLCALGVLGVALYGIARSTVFLGVGIIVGGLAVLASPRLCRGMIDLVTAPRLLRRLRPRLHELHQGLLTLVRPATLSWATALAVVAWLAECVGFALIIRGFPGTEVPLALAILIYAVTTVAGALSFLPGGLLVTEAGMTLLLVQSARGVDHATAAAATILVRLATLWFAVALGLAALALLRRLAPATRGALEPEASAAEDDVAEADAASDEGR